MKHFTNEKGVTLTALAITIIILLILSTVGIQAGMNSIENSKLTAFSTELQSVQRKVDELNQKYQNGDISVLQIGILPQGTQQELTAFNGAEEKNYTGYMRYEEKELNELGFSNFTNQYLVNVAKRSVIALNGIKYKGEIYWTVEQLKDDLYLVDY